MCLKMKTCSKCKLELQLEQFSKNKKVKDGHKSQCKACEKIYREENKEKVSERMKKYYEENKEKVRERMKKYYEENKENVIEQNKKYYEENKEMVSERAKKYYEENKENLNEWMKKYYEENKEEKKEYRKKYYEENKEEMKEYRKKYRKEHKEGINEYRRNRFKTDKGFGILCRLRARLHKVLKGKNKSASTMKLVGCTIEELLNHLEKTKVEGKDYSDAHVDHIRPCASFDLTDPEQQRECFHYTNLQWLPAKENMSKGAKWNHETISTETFLNPRASIEANLCLPLMIV